MSVSRRAGFTFVPLMLFLTANNAAGEGTYLLSIRNVPVRGDERITGFAIETWGVEFKAVCSIPPGWRIKAGSSASPDGDLIGEASHGVTWLYGPNAKDLRNFVLIKLYGPIDRHDIVDKTGTRSATFKGKVTLEGADTERTARLTYRNIGLKRAVRCPWR